MRTLLVPLALLAAIGAVVYVARPDDETIRPCSEFDTQAEAQAYYATKDFLSSDYPDIDPNNDGVSCDQLP